MLATALLALSSVVFAQNNEALHPELRAREQQALDQKVKNVMTATTSLIGNTCFSGGAQNTYMNFCVTPNGNIVSIESPQGHPLISWDLGEGYGVCDLSTQTSYTDYGGLVVDVGSWGSATILSQTTKSLKVVRTTTDGLWTLTQTITQISGPPPAIKIVMALKNNTSSARHVFLVRYADVDAGGTVLNDFSSTINGTFGWNDIYSSQAFGIVMQNLGTVSFRHFGMAVASYLPPNACAATSGFSGYFLTGVDGSLRYLYDTTINSLQTLTVTMMYRGL
jgi:hypothetical protein